MREIKDQRPKTKDLFKTKDQRLKTKDLCFGTESRNTGLWFLVFGLWSSVFCLLISGCSPQSADKAATTITVWHWMTDREEAFGQLARRYREKTGIKVHFELYAPSDAYTQKVRAAAQAATLPDIFGLLGEKRDFASFVIAGHIADLSKMYENKDVWRERFFSRAVAVNEFLPGNEFGVKSGIYGLPLDVMNIQMLYNRDLLRKAGVRRAPRTWDEFLRAGSKLRQAGIQGFVSGWGEIWMIDCFASNYAFNIMGEQKVMDTIRGKVPYTDGDWIKVFGLFREMADNGLVDSGVVTMVNKTAEQLFANGKAAFAFNGSWCVNVYSGMNPELNYRAMLPPARGEFAMKIWGGSGSSFLVNEHSLVKQQAIDFLRWLSQDEQQAFLAGATNNLPANKNCLGRISPILSDFARAMEQITHPNIWPVHEFPLVIEAFDKGIQAIIIGEKTPQQAAAEVQAVKEREVKRKTKDRRLKTED